MECSWFVGSTECSLVGSMLCSYGNMRYALSHKPSTAPRSLPRLLPHFSLRADYVERATIFTRKPHAKLSVDAESWRVRRVFVYMGGGTVI